MSPVVLGAPGLLGFAQGSRALKARRTQGKASQELLGFCSANPNDRQNAPSHDSNLNPKLFHKEIEPVGGGCCFERLPWFLTLPCTAPGLVLVAGCF